MTGTVSLEHRMRSVDRIFRAPAPHWVGDGFRVRGFFNVDPTLQQQLDPFVLLDYHEPYKYEPNSGQARGVGPHPHRGFETVTIAFSGAVAHHDSAGNSGVINPGGVQWMTAAAGILHQEYHSAEFSRTGGVMQMAQLWVNLPAAAKMSAPGYQHLDAADITEVAIAGGGTVRIIAGNYAGATGPARTHTPVYLFEIRLPAGVEFRLPLAAEDNAALVVMSGGISADGVQAAENELVLFGHDGDGLAFTAQTDAHLLFLGGRPIGEPVLQYGPFVMNTETEIVQAIRDYKNGAFGEL